MAGVDRAEFLIRIISQRLQRINDIFALIGIAYTTKVSLQLCWTILEGFRTHVYSRLTSVDFRKKYGDWAVVTGSTDGIGKAYCMDLAKRGMNIILLSRNMEKLQCTAEEIKTKYAVKVEVIQADFSHGQEIYDRLNKLLSAKDIGILVNNVGVMCTPPMRFLEMTKNTIWDHILVNVAAMTMMTHIILPGMVKRKRGAVINISSASSLYPLPWMAVYSSTKIYIDYFTRALQYEYRNSGVDIQSIIPFYVSTSITSRCPMLIRRKLLVPNAENFTSSAVCTLGHSKQTTGYWSHAIQYSLVKAFMGEWVWIRCGAMLQRFLRHDVKQTMKARTSIT